MKSKDLGEMLDNFVGSNYRSVLIDGPWGCGKTYQIRKCIKKHENTEPQIDYISLFGKESIDEINTELYRIIHPGLFQTKKMSTLGLNLISKAFAPFPVVGGVSGIADALSFVINDIPDKNISGNRIIVFDDLERVDTKLSYISLLGYMNSLFFAQVRIVCLCSSENIDTKKIGEFHDFKEKVFDRMHVIDETEEEVISGYFGGHEIKNLSLMMNEFGNNLRQAQKTASFFNEIVTYAEKKSYNITEKISDFELVRSCFQAIKICFDQHKKPIFTSNPSDTTESIRQFSYAQDVKAVGENIANGLYELFGEQKNTFYDSHLKAYSENVIKGLIDIFLFKNFTIFDSIFKPINDVVSSEDFLNNSVYFLSDANKEKYAQEFFKQLFERKIVFDKVNNQRFADILRFTDYELDENDRNKVIELMFEQTNDQDNQNMDVGNTIIDILRMAPERRGQSFFVPWIEQIQTTRQSLLVKSIIEQLETLYRTKKYVDMDKLIDSLETRLETSDNKEIIEYLVDHEFLLPDLSGNLTYAEWNYAHQVASYTKKIQKDKDFIEYAISKCVSQPNNKSLIERFEALVFYRIDKDFKLREAVQKRLVVNK